MMLSDTQLRRSAIVAWLELLLLGRGRARTEVQFSTRDGLQKLGVLHGASLTLARLDEVSTMPVATGISLSSTQFRGVSLKYAGNGCTQNPFIASPPCHSLQFTCSGGQEYTLLLAILDFDSHTVAHTVAHTEIY